MITTISPVTIHNHKKLTFRTYSLGNLSVCSAMLFTIVAVLYITSPWLIYFIAVSLYPLTPLADFFYCFFKTICGNTFYAMVITVYLPYVMQIFSHLFDGVGFLLTNFNFCICDFNVKYSTCYFFALVRTIYFTPDAY